MSYINYPWRPSSRPPPADPAKAGRIALLSPFGKCLETALDGLVAEDGGGGASDSVDEEKIMGEKKNEGHGSGVDGARTQEEEKNGGAESDALLDSSTRIDGEISKAILGAYRKAAGESIFDGGGKIRTADASPMLSSHPSRRRAPPQTGGSPAPAATLHGTVDHYNRVGGQWRIVVRDAVLRPRRIKEIVDGVSSDSVSSENQRGRQHRRLRGRGESPPAKRLRAGLDWDDDDVGSGEDERANPESPARKDGDLRIKGTVQILAYDDDL